MKPGEPSPSMPKRNIHGSKIMLYIWWDMWGVIYYELLKPSETINSQLYRLQLMRLKQAIQAKRLEWRDKHEKLMLQHDNARPHVDQPVRTFTPRRSEMGCSIPPAVFTRHCPFRLSFVPVDAVGTYWRALHFI